MNIQGRTTFGLLPRIALVFLGLTFHVTLLRAQQTESYDWYIAREAMYQPVAEDVDASAALSTPIDQVVVEVNEAGQEIAGRVALNFGNVLSLYTRVAQPISSAQKTVVPLELSGISAGAKADVGIVVMFMASAPTTRTHVVQPPGGTRVFNTTTWMADIRSFDSLMEDAPSFRNQIEEAVAEELPIRIAANVRWSRTSLDFLDTNLAEHTFDKTAFGLEVGAGATLTRWAFVGITYQRGTAFKPAAERTFVIPFAGAGDSLTLVQRKGSLGEPNETDIGLLTFEGRFLFDWFGRAGTLGLNPSIAIGMTDKKGARIDLPIYFMQDAKQGLRGGIKLSCIMPASGDAQFNLGVFLTEAFQVFK
jgi:hypothetical protein